MALDRVVPMLRDELESLDKELVQLERDERSRRERAAKAERDQRQAAAAKQAEKRAEVRRAKTTLRYLTGEPSSNGGSRRRNGSGKGYGKRYSQETLDRVVEWLKENGPATRKEVAKGTGIYSAGEVISQAREQELVRIHSVRERPKGVPGKGTEVFAVMS